MKHEKLSYEDNLCWKNLKLICFGWSTAISYIPQVCLKSQFRHIERMIPGQNPVQIMNIPPSGNIAVEIKGGLVRLQNKVEM